MEKLISSRWAFVKNNNLIPLSGDLPIQMSSSDAKAQPLVLLQHKNFGADVICFAPGKRVGLHTHEGDHILIVTKGEGVLTYGSEKHKLDAGMIYLVPGSVPHAIDAVTELALIAIGNDHRPAHSPTRLEIIEEQK